MLTAELLHHASDGHGLALALELPVKLVARGVIDEDQAADGRFDLGDERVGVAVIGQRLRIATPLSSLWAISRSAPAR